MQQLKCMSELREVLKCLDPKTCIVDMNHKTELENRLKLYTLILQFA